MRIQVIVDDRDYGCVDLDGDDVGRYVKTVSRLTQLVCDVWDAENPEHGRYLDVTAYATLRPRRPG